MIREKNIRVFDYKGKKITLEFISSNHGMEIWIKGDAHYKDGYLYNIYSKYYSLNSTLRFHRKLKVYNNDSHGRYVVCQGVRCYCNGLIPDKEK